ncbi:MAG: DUF2254 domain-containing protein [Gemmatimonadales bacterium]
MKVSIAKYWDRLQTSFWFVPAGMAASAIALSVVMVAFDRKTVERGDSLGSWVYSGGAEGASAVLGTIAGSMITIAGVVFSLTLVALSLASSQLGPRLLRNFMRDRANQVVLGTFVATFLYSLLVLRTIRRADEIAFVPHLAVTLAVLLAIASIAVLIYFIHHVSVSIQADAIIARVYDDVIAGIARLYLENPADVAEPPPEARNTADPSEAGTQELPALGDGYIDFIDIDALVEFASEAGVVIRLLRRPGTYVVRGSVLAQVSPPRPAHKSATERVNDAIVLSSQRSPAQDVEFSVNQLVEIAVRALSPGVNDPFTAVACVDRLGSALAFAARRNPRSPLRFDESGALRVIVQSPSFENLCDSAFNQIRQNAGGNAALTIRLLETIEMIAPSSESVAVRDPLVRHAEMIIRGARQGLAEENDLRDAEQRFVRASAALHGAS